MDKANGPVFPYDLAKIYEKVPMFYVLHPLVMIF
jgi:hypothetical protein